MGAMLNLLLASGFAADLLDILRIIMVVVDVLLVLLAVYMFFMMSTASSEAKRRNCKKHFFNLLSSIFIIVALIGFLSVIKVNLTPVQQETDKENGTEAGIFENCSIADQSMAIFANNYNNVMKCTGSFTITTRAVNLPKGNGAKVVSLANFKTATGASGFNAPSYWSTTPNSDGSIKVMFSREVTRGNDGRYHLPLESGRNYLEFSVYVTVETEDGPVSKDVYGKLKIASNNSYIAFT